MRTSILNFESLVEKNKQRLNSYAFNFTRDEDEAKDLVQDTLLKAHVYFKKFKTGTNFRGWVYTIMKNIFINNYRRYSRLKEVFIKEDELSSGHLTYSASRNTGELKFVNKDIERAIRSLSEHIARPFLDYFEGYKYHEIAERYNIPVGTIKTRIHQARVALKKQLKVYESRADL